jgi:hypothetical protein
VAWVVIAFGFDSDGVFVQVPAQCTNRVEALRICGIMKGRYLGTSIRLSATFHAICACSKFSLCGVAPHPSMSPAGSGGEPVSRPMIPVLVWFPAKAEVSRIGLREPGCDPCRYLSCPGLGLRGTGLSLRLLYSTSLGSLHAFKVVA